MRQLLQQFKDGSIDIIDVPVPECKTGHIIAKSSLSLISAGTERMLLEFGKSNIISKARSQPDKVKQVIDKMRSDGIVSTLNAVFSKLDTPISLGYSNVGRVIETGSTVYEFNRGDRIVSNGPHAEVVSVPTNLCAKVPEEVSDEEAVFTVLGAIALQGVRLINPKVGENVVVMGLGLIGLLTVQILLANGCRVLGLDFDKNKLSLASSFGSEIFDLASESDPVGFAMKFSKNNGVDSVLITASTKSNDPVRLAAQMCRKRAKIVLVGLTGLELNRADFYEKELSFQVSCSYGPGRYDELYEQRGYDYPYGFVRWTAKRNFEAVLDLIARRKINIQPLISKSFPFSEAQNAYSLLLEDKTNLGILLRYISSDDTITKTIQKTNIRVVSTARTNAIIGVIGAGNFASHVILPILKKADVRLKTIASSGGMNAAILGNKFGFEKVTSDSNIVFDDPEINTVFIATRHNSHANLTVSALEHDKHVFVEKPLALNETELVDIETTYKKMGDKQLLVGFNRRFSPFAQKMKALLNPRSSPLTAVYIVNAGALPTNHWTRNSEIGGGRIIGEACHFIDLLQFIIDHPIVSVNSTAIGGERPLNEREDKVTISILFSDGSTGTVHYFANGNKKYPKEKVVIFSDERVLELDNYIKMRGYGFKKFRTMKTWKQEKGHREELTAFISRVEIGGGALIPWESMESVTRASFLAMQNICHSTIKR
jgi:predicted dehydrogenase/threonine dehydrogenase-like Zn-dependent dehydrogenase